MNKETCCPVRTWANSPKWEVQVRCQPSLVNASARAAAVWGKSHAVGIRKKADSRRRAGEGTLVWDLPCSHQPTYLLCNLWMLNLERLHSRKAGGRRSPPYFGAKGNTGWLVRRVEKHIKPFWRQTDLSARGHAKWTFSARGSEARGAGDSDSAGERGGARDRSGKDTASQRRGARGARTHWRKTL